MYLRTALVALAATIMFAAPVLADQPVVPTISVSGVGSVSYTPDIARISLGVRSEAPTAAAAATATNAKANAVIEAIRRLGFTNSNVRTAGYQISYQPPPAPGPGTPQYAPPPMTSMPGEVQLEVMARKPMPAGGTYIATELIEVTSSVEKAGSVLDAGVNAGADETFGLMFDTTQRDALYREALAKAVDDARAQADLLAHSAGQTIVRLMSLATGYAPRSSGMAPMALMSGGPPVMPGTETISATVQAVYQIR